MVCSFESSSDRLLGILIINFTYQFLSMSEEEDLSSLNTTKDTVKLLIMRLSDLVYSLRIALGLQLNHSMVVLKMVGQELWW